MARYRSQRGSTASRKATCQGSPWLYGDSISTAPPAALRRTPAEAGPGRGVWVADEHIIGTWANTPNFIPIVQTDGIVLAQTLAQVDSRWRLGKIFVVGGDRQGGWWTLFRSKGRYQPNCRSANKRTVLPLKLPMERATPRAVENLGQRK